jgi:phosphatidylglycerophosphate synthase
VTRLLSRLGITPNTVTIISFALSIVTGVLFAYDYLWEGMIVGYLMAFSDIVDGQLAKEHSMTTKFGGILDSTIDRYNEFFIYAGLGVRYYFYGRPLWTLVCVLVFLGSIMVSYVKARAEVDGFKCRVGMLQRPERLTIVAIGIAFNGFLLDPTIALLAVFTQATVLQRVVHVYRQSRQEKVPGERH